MGVGIVAADTSPLSCCVTGSYNAHVSHNYRFKRGDPVRIGWGRYAGATGVVDSAVFQKPVDFRRLFRWLPRGAGRRKGRYGAMGPGSQLNLADGR